MKLCDNPPDTNWCPVYKFRPDEFCKVCMDLRSELPILLEALKQKNEAYQSSVCHAVYDTREVQTKICCGGRTRSIPILACPYQSKIDTFLCRNCAHKQLQPDLSVLYESVCTGEQCFQCRAVHRGLAWRRAILTECGLPVTEQTLYWDCPENHSWKVDDFQLLDPNTKYQTCPWKKDRGITREQRCCGGRIKQVPIVDCPEKQDVRIDDCAKCTRR